MDHSWIMMILLCGCSGKICLEGWETAALKMMYPGPVRRRKGYNSWNTYLLFDPLPQIFLSPFSSSASAASHPWRLVRWLMADALGVERILGEKRPWISPFDNFVPGRWLPNAGEGRRGPGNETLTALRLLKISFRSNQWSRHIAPYCKEHQCFVLITSYRTLLEK